MFTLHKPDKLINKTIPFKNIYPTLLFIQNAFWREKTFIINELSSNIKYDLDLLFDKNFLDVIFSGIDNNKDFTNFYHNYYIKNIEKYKKAVITLIFCYIFNYDKTIYINDFIKKEGLIYFYGIIYLGLLCKKIYEEYQNKKIKNFNKLSILNPNIILGRLPSCTEKYTGLGILDLTKYSYNFQEILKSNIDNNKYLLFYIKRNSPTQNFDLINEYQYKNPPKVFKKFIINGILKNNKDTFYFQKKADLQSNTTAVYICVMVLEDKDARQEYEREEKKRLLREKKEANQKKKKEKEDRLKEEKRKREEEKRRKREEEKEKKRESHIEGKKRKKDKKDKKGKRGKHDSSQLANDFESLYSDSDSDSRHKMTSHDERRERGKRKRERKHQQNRHHNSSKRDEKPKRFGSILNFVSNDFSSSRKKDEKKDKKENHPKKDKQKQDHQHQKPKQHHQHPPTKKKNESSPTKQEKKEVKNEKIEKVPPKKKIRTPFEKELYFVGLIEFLVRNHLPDLHYFMVKGYEKNQKQIDDYIVDISFSLHSKIHFTKMSKLLYHIFYQIYHSKVKAYLTLELFTAKKFKFSSDMTKNEETLFKEKFIENMKNEELSQIFVREMISKFKDLSH